MTRRIRKEGKSLPKWAGVELGEFVLHALNHAQADGLEIGRELPGLGSEAAALCILAADLGFDQLPAQGLLRLLDTAPHVAIALAEVAGRLLDRAGMFHGLQHLAQPVAERVAAIDLQPYLDSRR